MNKIWSYSGFASLIASSGQKVFQPTMEKGAYRES